MIVSDFIDDFWVNMGASDDTVTLRDYVEMGSNGDIRINLGEGNNDARIVDCKSRYLTVNTRSGSDAVTIEDCRTDFLVVKTNLGDDEVILDGAFSDRGAVIETSGGWDDVHLRLGSATESDFLIDTGSGDDLVSAENFGGYDSGLIIETGDDEDRVTLFSGMVDRGFNGVNSLNIVGFEMSWIDVDLGRGDDILLNHMAFYTGNYLFNGGRGTDAHMKLTPPSPLDPAVSLAVAPWAFLNFEHSIVMPSLQFTIDPFMPDMEPFRDGP